MNQNLDNLDKKTTDKGWKAMEEILDREMPVKQSRRWFWLLCLLALLLPAAGILLWFSNPPKTVPAPISTAERPIAGINPGTTSPAQTATATPAHTPEHNTLAATKTILAPSTLTTQTSSPAQAATATPAHTPEHNALAATETIPAPNTQTTQPTSPAQAATNTPEHNAIAASKTIPTPSTPTTQTTSPAQAATSTPANAPEHNALASTETIPAPNTQTTQTISLAQTATATPASTPEHNAIAATKITPALVAEQAAAPDAPITPVQKKSMSWGATVGVLAKPFARFAGTSIGLTSDWQAGKRWGLRTGLAHQYHRLQGQDRPIASVTSGAFAEATGDQAVFSSNGFVVNAVDFTAPVYVAVSRLHRVEMPLSAFWQATPKVRLYGGAAVGLNLYAQTGDRGLKDGKTFDIKPGAPARNLNQKVSQQMHDWQWRWNVGIGYRPIRNLEVGLFFHTPVAGLTNNNFLLDASSPVSSPSYKLSDGFEALSSERRDAIKGRSLFQLSATAFF